MWAYRDVTSNFVLFEYQRGRSKEGPARMLKDYKGNLQTDGYAAYDQFNHRDGITMLHCIAHARRYFNEAEDNDKERSGYAFSTRYIFRSTFIEFPATGPRAPRPTS